MGKNRTGGSCLFKKDSRKISMLGHNMHELAKKLFPICRSITGDGVRQTLAILQQHIPEIKKHEVPSGALCFDWIVPDEWNIQDAYIVTPDGKRVAEFKHSNLHVLNYSEPVHKKVTLEELNKHLYSLPEQPDAIPYVTSYYKRRWGFCLSDRERQELKPGLYEVYINSTLKPGHLTYGELIIPGKTTKEIFLSTYICHPSLANNELSGPVVTTFIAQWLMSLPERKFTYRIVFIPETIGSIVYLSLHHESLKKNVYAGFNISCVGDDRAYSYLPSRKGNTISDRIALHVLKHIAPNFMKYSFRDRGSDERQYCSPGIDLPIASVMRSKYGEYPEYHTSLDNLEFISPEGLEGGYQVLKHCLECLEFNQTLKTQCYGEPQLGKRGLYPTLGVKKPEKSLKDMMDIIAYCDGEHDLLSIADMINIPLWETRDIVKKLIENAILLPVNYDAHVNILC